MKKILLTVLSFGICLNLFSQTHINAEEPEYIGEVISIQDNGETIIPLEKKSTKVKTKAGVSMYLTGIGKIKSKINIEGNTSPVVLQSNEPLTFIVKSFDNKSDPLSIISLIKFETTKKERKSELSSVGTFSGGSTNNQNYIEYTAKKYKDSSYELHVDSLAVGEYGIIVANPNTASNGNLIIACFSVQD